MSIDASFGRALLTEAVIVLRQHFPKLKPMRDAWVWHAGRSHWEFHGPDGFYWHGKAGGAYEARYNGWMAWLQHRGIEL